MRVYWDTSAAINAAISKPVWERLSKEEHFARTHLLSEFFSTMTGRGIAVLDAAGNPVRYVMSAKDASVWLRKFARRVSFVDLDAQETLDGLDEATMKGVQGGRVHDYGHALSAIKAKADVILTRNPADFGGLSAIALEQP